MKQMQMLIIIAIIGTTSFALGWFMRGDMIYSNMFNQSAMVMGAMK